MKRVPKFFLGRLSHIKKVSNDKQKQLDDLEFTLLLVATGIWRDKKSNTCGLVGAAMVVHAVENALRNSSNPIIRERFKVMAKTKTAAKKKIATKSKIKAKIVKKSAKSVKKSAKKPIKKSSTKKKASKIRIVNKPSRMHRISKPSALQNSSSRIPQLTQDEKLLTEKAQAEGVYVESFNPEPIQYVQPTASS